MTLPQAGDTPSKRNIPKLYLLTNDDDFALLYRKLEAALATRTIGLLQIRRKKVLAQAEGHLQLAQEAERIVALARQYDTPVVMNDDIDLAAKLGIGVHLGQQDGDVRRAVAELPAGQIIGRTCHGSIEFIETAIAEGASYAAMGAVFTSSTKPQANTLSREQLLAGCAFNCDIDLCVIGGLTPEHISQISGLPLTYIAVVGDIMDLPVADIAGRCAVWQQALLKWYDNCD